MVSPHWYLTGVAGSEMPLIVSPAIYGTVTFRLLCSSPVFIRGLFVDSIRPSLASCTFSVLDDNVLLPSRETSLLLFLFVKRPCCVCQRCRHRPLAFMAGSQQGLTTGFPIVSLH